MEEMDLYDIDRIKTSDLYFRGGKLAKDRYFVIVHLCIFNDKNQMLIQQREDTGAFGGLWDLSCGGASKKGESSREAIERETLEELGLNLDFTGLRPIITANFDKGFDDIYIIRKNLSLNDLVLEESEVKDVSWADLDTVLGLLKDKKFMAYKESFIRLLFDLDLDMRIMEI
ncbi:MAG: NUDIX domain-containing protein [Anaerococcus sp.]|nr:NUDIX domain-containing protein [Anaerococcus sp.]